MPTGTAEPGAGFLEPCSGPAVGFPVSGFFPLSAGGVFGGGGGAAGFRPSAGGGGFASAFFRPTYSIAFQNEAGATRASSATPCPGCRTLGPP